MSTPIMMLLLTCLLLLLPMSTHGACLPIDLAPTLQEQYEASELVARLKLKDPPETIQLPCGILVFDEQGTFTYIIQDQFPSYEIIELFKGNVDGSEIPIAWWTDTGYRTNIPTYITDDADGFLAIMDSHKVCENDTSTSFPYPDDYKPIPYEAGECSYGNQRWSSVSEEDQAWLREQAVAGGGAAPSPAPTPVISTSEPLMASDMPTQTESFMPTQVESLVPTTFDDTTFPSIMSPGPTPTGTGAVDGTLPASPGATSDARLVVYSLSVILSSLVAVFAMI